VERGHAPIELFFGTMDENTDFGVRRSQHPVSSTIANVAFLHGKVHDKSCEILAGQIPDNHEYEYVGAKLISGVGTRNSPPSVTIFVKNMYNSRVWRLIRHTRNGCSEPKGQNMSKAYRDFRTATVGNGISFLRFAPNRRPSLRQQRRFIFVGDERR
jgi:hypothetical protein